MKAASIIVGVVLAIVMVVAISEAGNGGSASVPSTGSASIGPSSSSSGGTDYSNDPASLLAARDGSGDTADYSAALTEFASLCTEDRVTVAGYADAAHDDLAKHGINMSRLQVLQQLALSVPASAAPIDCDGVTAAWLVLEEK